MSVWNTLSKIDVSKHIEKKNGFSYVSWAWAWAILKTNYPSAYYVKHMYDFGGTKQPYMLDNSGNAYVCVTVHIPEAEESQTEVMPVLNHANRPIQNPNSFEVNAQLQRCLVKTIAAFGLGISLYAGEDLPLAVKAEGGDNSSQQSAAGRGSSSSPDLAGRDTRHSTKQRGVNPRVGGEPHMPETVSGPDIEQLVRLAPTMESLKELYNKVQLRLSPDQVQLFSKRRKELEANG